MDLESILPNDKQIYKSDEVMRLLGVGYQTLYKYVREKKLAPIKTGKFNYFTRKNLLDYFQNYIIGDTLK